MVKNAKAVVIHTVVWSWSTLKLLPPRAHSVKVTYIRLFGAFVLWICVLFQRDFYKPDRHQRVRNTWVTFWLTEPVSSFWNVWLWKKDQEILSNWQKFTNLPSNLFPLGHTLCFTFWRINGETRWFGGWGLHKARGDHGDFTFQWLSYVPAWCLHTTPKATSITFRWQVWSSPRLTDRILCQWLHETPCKTHVHQSMIFMWLSW